MVGRINHHPSPHKAGRLVLLMVLGCGLICESIRAGTPFFTDDPSIIPPWEIRLGTVYTRTEENDVVSVPVLDLNYAPTAHIQYNAIFSGVSSDPADGANGFGLGDTDLKIKWRFVDEDATGKRPALSVAPLLSLPTAAALRGLDNGVYRLRLPMEIGKNFGNCYAYAEAGYEFALDRAAQDAVFGGAVLQYQVTEKLMLGIELNATTPIPAAGDWTLLANVGAAYQFDEHFQILGALGRTVRRESLGGPIPVVQVYLQWNF